MPKSHKVETVVLTQTLKHFGGDYAKTAEHLDVSKRYVYKRVAKDPQLRAIYIKSGVGDALPDEAELMSRDNAPPVPPDAITKAVLVNGSEAFDKELHTILHDPKNAAKLQIFKNFDDSIGLLLANALRITQKINIRQNLALFEVSEQLREELESALDPEERILKTRLYIMTCEQQGKFQDRLLKQVEAMIKMQEKNEKRQRKKPGFMPLRELRELEEDQL